MKRGLWGTNEVIWGSKLGILIHSKGKEIFPIGQYMG